MITIRQHRPAFIDISIPPQQAEVTTLNELLALPWIARWREVPERHKSFDGFFYSQNCLMVTYDENQHWYVIGYLKENPGLPEWEKG